MRDIFEGLQQMQSQLEHVVQQMHGMQQKLNAMVDKTEREMRANLTTTVERYGSRIVIQEPTGTYSGVHKVGPYKSPAGCTVSNQQNDVQAALQYSTSGMIGSLQLSGDTNVTMARQSELSAYSRPRYDTGR